ncbi:hypothetical protein NC653_013369 [Populus alba x Populus x berolinensis]|uniref:Uncharacterized protein n=1 Tax=Populus alba x Populus x berolinensis TaxID=444605 RepID=A0AAD6QUC6_9ROSI|nr:hypothetical protein NC653_013369 [Populus alba x Populus x berolinensis]
MGITHQHHSQFLRLPFLLGLDSEKGRNLELVFSKWSVVNPVVSDSKFRNNSDPTSKKICGFGEWLLGWPRFWSTLVDIFSSSCECY